jgi:hypothetical protein
MMTDSEKRAITQRIRIVNAAPKASVTGGGWPTVGALTALWERPDSGPRLRFAFQRLTTVYHRLGVVVVEG